MSKVRALFVSVLLASAVAGGAVVSTSGESVAAPANHTTTSMTGNSWCC